MTGEFAVFEPLLVAFFLSLPRLVVIFVMLPFLGSTTIPGLLHIGVSISMVLILQPLMWAELPEAGLFTWTTLLLALKEALVGLFIGFVFAIVFHAVEAAGFFIDNQRGSTMASSMDPLLGGQTSPLGLLFTHAFVVYFFVSGGFLSMMAIIYGSYQIMPVLSFVPVLTMEGAMFMLSQIDRLVEIAFVLAAPVFTAMFVAEIGVALISRFVPQLQVFFLAMPIKSGVAMLVLVLYIYVFLSSLDTSYSFFDGLIIQLQGVI